jgi:hypothetical protein
LNVFKVGCRELVQPDITKDPTEPPLVLKRFSMRLKEGRRGGQANLILYVSAVTPLVDLDMEVIGARTSDKRGYVEFARIPGSLGVADLAVVHPHGECRVDTLKTQPQLVPCIMGEKLECRHVAATLVVIDWYAGGINGKGVVVVGIMRSLAVALELPHARDIDDPMPAALLRRQVTGLPLVEVGGALEGRLGQMEEPFPREQAALGAVDIARDSVDSVLVQEEVGSWRQRVPVDDVEVVPVWRRRGEHMGLAGAVCPGGARCIGRESQSREGGGPLSWVSSRHRSNCREQRANAGAKPHQIFVIRAQVR